ncbi:retrovirus-related Pol polyprotein from transposon TNT 1-94 [Trichonephila clavipes]|nr:retrovirus-related Pol polyprotein from transposon TNT 1-94 [Trichonephila clavipes]
MNSVASTLNRGTDMEFNNRISVLTPNNWNTWKHDIQVLLMHYDCWQFIVQTKPEQPDEESTYKEKLDLQLLAAWKILKDHFEPVTRAREFQSTVQQIYRWKEEDFRVVKIEAELILEANRLQLMKQDLEKAENAYLSSFTSKKSKTLPGATAAAHGDPNGKMITKRKVQSPREFHSKDGAVRSKRPLELLHMDLCGPMPTESQGGNKYFLSIIDDYSRKVTVFPIRNKSDVFHTFIRFQKRAERFLSKKVIAVRTDGGLEFCNKDMDNFLTELGIKHEVTNSYTPEMNGVAERFNLTALDGIKTLLKSSEVPHKFWEEALLCFTYAWNRICHKDSNKTPFEKIFRQKVNSNLGYNLNLPDYYDDEDDFDRVKDSLTSRLVSKTSTETPSTSEKPDVSSDNHSLIPCTEVKWIRNIGRKVTGSNVYYSIEGEATRLKSFNEIERYCKRHNIEYDPSLFNFRKDNTESQGFSDLSEQQEALMVEVTIPICYKQAIRSRDSSKWRDAMDKEINVMMERKVWDLVDHSDNIKILENRWVYTIKYDENNKIVRYKARLVARGNTQLRGESFDEIFQEYQLELSKIKSLKLRCYSDSDFATNRNDRVSMGGFITFIDETPISWRTFKQKSVSLSTMEAEYVSLTEAAKEFIWLKNVIDNKSLNLELSENVMFCDNQATISFSKSPVENCRTKHIDVRYHFLRNLIYDKVFQIKYIGTKNNLADIFTKPMVKGKNC